MKRFKHWLSRGVALAFGLLLAGNFLLPQAFAANECECFCGEMDLGATSAGPFESANECAQFCADLAGFFEGVATQYIGCFTNEDMYPENSNLCWTESECSSYPVEISSTTYYGKWGGQSAYCSKESVTGSSMGYCYGPLLPVTLNVPILGVTEIAALGDYVNLLYQYAIPLVGLLGVLMFTIAGFQYMTAGGDKGAVAKAKTRMSNTVIGIIMIMSVYIIAYLIDPRLTRFNELRPPMVKEAVIVNDATTCEALLGYKFDVSPKTGKCGEKGEITGNNNVKLNIANPPEVGDTCLFSGCDDRAKSCVIKGDKSGGECVACDDVSELNKKLGIVPSASTCSQIAARAESGFRDGREHVCAFDNDLSEFSEADGVGVDECVKLHTVGDDYINCNKLKDWALKKEDACEVYDERIDASSYSIDGGILGYIFDAGSADQIEDFKNVYGSLCEQDVCGIADFGSDAQGNCAFVDMNYIVEVLGDVALFDFDIFVNYGCVGAETLSGE